MTKIKWKKTQWIHKGYFQYRLDRESHCGKWIIHRWDNDKQFFISLRGRYYGLKSWEIVSDIAGIRFFDSLRGAKEYCEVNNGSTL